MSTPRLFSITTLSLLFVFLYTHFLICNGVSVLSFNYVSNTEIDVMVRRGCSRKVEDDLVETKMESEISRRVLVAQKRYISYETLRRDMVPCAKPGASYYSCNSGQANPYRRGCEVITRCARNIKDIET